MKWAFGLVVIGAVLLGQAMISLVIGSLWFASLLPVAARFIFMHQVVFGLVMIDSVLLDQGRSTRWLWYSPLAW